MLASRLAGAIPQLPTRPDLVDNPPLAGICTEILQRSLAVDRLNRIQTPSEFLTLLEHAREVERNGDDSFGPGPAEPHPARSCPTGQTACAPALCETDKVGPNIHTLLVVTGELAMISTLCTGLIWGMFELLERL